VQFLVRPRPLQQRVIFLLVGWCGIVEDDHPHGMAVPPKVFIALFNGFAHVAQSMRGNDE
jgi:hypothetical protein